MCLSKIKHFSVFTDDSQSRSFYIHNKDLLDFFTESDPGEERTTYSVPNGKIACFLQCYNNTIPEKNALNDIQPSQVISITSIIQNQ